MPRGEPLYPHVPRGKRNETPRRMSIPLASSWDQIQHSMIASGADRYIEEAKKVLSEVLGRRAR